MTAPVAAMLPPLRQELRIEPGAPLVTGAPSWTLFDPIRQLFYQVGRVEFRVFSLWSRGDIDDVRAGLRAEGLSEDAAERAIGRTLEFAFANSLTVTPARDTVASLTAQRAATRRDWWRWMLDHYLFVRIPLVRPARFLQRTLPRVAPLWSPASLIAFALLGLVGLYLVSRQWDAFVASFLYFFNPEGFLAYAAALALVKVAHELGHAYTATRFGCPVPVMGVSFLVMMPVLYTDTTAAWRLTSRRKRLMIDCAGVTVELMIASVATFAWAFLPDGPLRSVAFVLATTNWITSVFVNLNPLMRFDGYYMMSDALGVPNLQPRAFALGRWRLREILFDLGEPPPEDMPPRLRRGLVAYAWIIWIYRLALYLGIALLVYHLFFKALGILLFAVEMTVFIGRPVLSELKQWGQRRERIAASPRARIWPWLLGGLLLLAVLPLDRHVTAPAVLAPIGDAPVVAGDPARIDKVLVQAGQQVEKDTPLFLLTAPEVDREAADRRVRIARIEAQIGRAMSDVEDLSNRTVLERELAAERDALAGLERRQDRLVLKAPAAGQVVDVAPNLHPGRWLNGAETLARVVTPGRYDVQAYVAADDIWRLKPDARARFVPNDAGQASRAARLVEASSSAVATLDQPLLASTNGGTIAVSQDAEHRLKPRAALYRVRLVARRDARESSYAVQATPGRIVIDAAGESLVSRLFRGAGRVVARESSLSG